MPQACCYSQQESTTRAVGALLKRDRFSWSIALEKRSYNDVFIVAIAGPLTNLTLWLASLAVVKYKLIDRKYYKLIVPMGKINMFLFIFNMIPIPGFDGYHFFANLFRAFL